MTLWLDRNHLLQRFAQVLNSVSVIALRATSRHCSHDSNIWRVLASGLYTLEYATRVDFERRAVQRSPTHQSASLTLASRQLVILDVGARGGILPVLEHLRRSATWHLFEPEIREFRRLQRRYRKDRNVQVYSLALGDHCGEINFFQTVKPGVASTLRPRLGGRFTVSKSRRVNVTTLETFCVERGITPDVLKLDVQGGEAAVLRGIGAVRPLLIWTELEGPEMYAGANMPSQTITMLTEMRYCLLSRRSGDYLFCRDCNVDVELVGSIRRLFELGLKGIG